MNVRPLDMGKHTFALEIGNTLQIEIEGFQSRLKSSLMGIVSNQYLIIETPQLRTNVGEPRHFVPGAEVVVRCLTRGRVWGFKSRLARVISTPVRLLLIEFPQEVENFSLRAHERIDCLLPGNIEIGKSSREGVLLDLSENGCCFSVKPLEENDSTDIEAGAQVTLRCLLPGIDGEQSVTGHVRQIHRDVLRTTFGIEFEQLDSKVRKRIAHFVTCVSQQNL